MLILSVNLVTCTTFSCSLVTVKAFSKSFTNIKKYIYDNVAFISVDN